MHIHPLTSTEWMKAIALGLATALLLSAVMVPLTVTGISPMPKPLGLAFAQTVLGEVPLPVGLLFHVAYVTIWSVAFVVLFRDDLSFVNALLLGLWLWVVVLVAFFPIVGWGFLGLAHGPRLIVASLVPHLLFALFLWAGCRLAFRTGAIMDQSAAAHRG